MSNFCVVLFPGDKHLAALDAILSKQGAIKKVSQTSADLITASHCIGAAFDELGIDFEESQEVPQEVYEKAASLYRANNKDCQMTLSNGNTYIVDPVTSEKWAVVDGKFVSIDYANDPVLAPLKELEMNPEMNKTEIRLAIQECQDACNNLLYKEPLMDGNREHAMRMAFSSQQLNEHCDTIAHLFSEYLTRDINRKIKEFEALVNGIEKDSIAWDQESVYEAAAITKNESMSDAYNKEAVLTALRKRLNSFYENRFEAARIITGGSASVFNDVFNDLEDVTDAIKAFEAGDYANFAPVVRLGLAKMNMLAGLDLTKLGAKNYEYLAQNIIPQLKKMLSTIEKIISFKKEIIQRSCSNLETIETDMKVNFKEATSNQKETDFLENEDNEDKEHWMTSYTSVSIENSMSAQMKLFFANIEQTDNAGKPKINSLGRSTFVGFGKTYVKIAQLLSDAVSESDVMDRLKKAAVTNPWINKVIKRLEESKATMFQDDYEKYDSFYAEFFHCFRKDEELLAAVEAESAYGVDTYTSHNINRIGGVQVMAEGWMQNLAGFCMGVGEDHFKIFNEDGTLNEEEYTALMAMVKSKANIVEKAKNDNEEAVNFVYEALCAIGMPIESKESLQKVLKQMPDNVISSIQNKIFDGNKGALAQLKISFGGANSNRSLIAWAENGYQNFHMKKMAYYFRDAAEAVSESSVTHNGKTRYSLVSPNFIGRLAKILSSEDTERAKKFLKEQYEFLYNSRLDSFNNNYLDFIYQNLKKGRTFDMEMSNMISFGEKDYTDFNYAETQLVGIVNFFENQGEDSDAKQNVAPFVSPLQADKPSMNLMRCPVYSVDDIKLFGGQRKTITGELDIQRGSVTQSLVNEINRINKVGKRLSIMVEAKQKGVKSPIAPITNYDAVFEIKDGKVKIKKPNGLTFTTHPFFNTAKFVYDAATDTLKLGVDGQSLLDILNSLDEMDTHRESIIRQAAKISYEENLNDYFEKLKREGLFVQKKNSEGKVKGLKYFMNIKGFENCKTAEDCKELLRKYYYNYAANQANMIEMLAVDSAFFKHDNWVDFQKRSGQWHAPAMRVCSEFMSHIDVTGHVTENTEANGFEARYPKDHIGRTSFRECYLSDFKMTSNAIAEIEIGLLNIGEQYLTEERANEYRTMMYELAYASTNERKAIVNKMKSTFPEIAEFIDSITDVVSNYRGINVADAECYMSLDAYLDVMKAYGDKNYKNIMRAIDHVKSGKITIEDYNAIAQTWKPFAYGITYVEDGLGGWMAVPHQGKNSQFPLLMTLFAAINNTTATSKKLNALNHVMKSRNIHMFQFESAIKAGCSATIDTNEKSLDPNLSAEQMADDIMGTIDENPQAVHLVAVDDWGFQNHESEHLVDHEALRGIQFQKLIASCISPDVNDLKLFDGNVINVQDWYHKYTDIVTADNEDALKDLLHTFGTKKAASDFLQRVIGSSDRYSEQLKKAVQLDSKGNFQYSLMTPAIRSQIAEIALAAADKALNKQKFKGGTCTQVSGYGVEDKLSLVFEDENGNEVRLDKNLSLEEREASLVGRKLHLKYMECFLPAYSKKLFEPLMDANGVLDIEKLPDELRRCIGYRVPTENKYSMCPLYIKGFSTQQNGSHIMVPAEITVLSGSDFDIDHMYIMLPEFKVEDNTENENYDAFVAATKEQPELADYFGIREDDTDLVKRSRVANVFKKIIMPKANKGLLKPDTADYNVYQAYLRIDQSVAHNKAVKYVNYDFNKPATEQTTEARTNGYLQLAWSVLTNSDTLRQFLKPGGFVKLAEAGNYCELAKMDLESIKRGCEITGIPFIADGQSKYDWMEALDPDDVTKIYKAGLPSVDPLSPATFSDFHRQNFVGKQMLAIFAVNLSSHALAQHKPTKLDAPVEFNGKVVDTLDAVRTPENDFTIYSLSEGVAGSADNVKDPNLAKMNISKFNINVETMMLRLGFSQKEVGILLSQPIVRYLEQIYTERGERGDFADIAATLWESFQKSGLVNDDLVMPKLSVAALVNSKGMTKQITESDIESHNIDLMQLATLKFVMGIAQNLKTFNNYNNEFKPEKRIKSSIEESVPNDELYTFNVDDHITDSFAVNYYSEMDESESPAMQPGILGTVLSKHQATNTIIRDIVKKLFPIHASNAWKMMKASLNSITAMSKSDLDSYVDKLMNFGAQTAQCFNEVAPADAFNAEGKISTKIGTATYEIKNPLDGTESPAERYEKVRNWYIKEMPKLLNKLKNNKLFKDSKLFKGLKVTMDAKSNAMPVVIFKPATKLDKYQIEDLQNEWLKLSESADPFLRRFATMLAVYSSYRNSFSGRNGGLGRIMPVEILDKLPGYNAALKDMKIFDEVTLGLKCLNQLLLSDKNFLDKCAKLIFHKKYKTKFFEQTEKGKDDMKSPKVVVEIDPGENKRLVSPFLRIEKKIDNPLTGKETTVTYYYKRVLKPGNEEAYQYVLMIPSANEMLEYFNPFRQSIFDNSKSKQFSKETWKKIVEYYKNDPSVGDMVQDIVEEKKKESKSYDFIDDEDEGENILDSIEVKKDAEEAQKKDDICPSGSKKAPQGKSVKQRPSLGDIWNML